MLEKIKKMKVEKKLKYCFAVVVFVASISGVLGLLMILRSDIQYSNALVDNGFSPAAMPQAAWNTDSAAAMPQAAWNTDSAAAMPQAAWNGQIPQQQCHRQLGTQIPQQQCRRQLGTQMQVREE